MTKINIRDMWSKEWLSAYAFFNSKGNTKTKARLKAKWYKSFGKMLKSVHNAMPDDEVK